MTALPRHLGRFSVLDTELNHSFQNIWPRSPRCEPDIMISSLNLSDMAAHFDDDLCSSGSFG